MPEYSGLGGPQGSVGQASENLGRFFNDLGGTTAANKFNAQEAEKARVYNSAEAAKDREFQEYMSNTAYQRAVADMRAAGINPAMANTQGGASTPGGAMGTAHQASSASPNGFHGTGVGKMISTIASIAIAKGLEAKFTNSALKAADHHELISARIKHMAHQEQMSARKVRDDAAFKKINSWWKAYDRGFDPRDTNSLPNLLYDTYR